ncbi:uncharacterized protein LOC127808818 isoform X2 [Diospyros lotus]|uniref:uncharacterized protein LOC127808818 isoform X2 n=1 Tax=Diospyros lotus TaxID=55363 RepID=UPI002250BDA6|nr:uncharacterized protein LOC127808818 isoform X2 [Diospyros lotus]
MEERSVEEANRSQITGETCDHIAHFVSCSSSSSTQQQQGSIEEVEAEAEEKEELKSLLVPNVRDLPLTPPSAVESNFVPYFAPDFIKPGHDQYVYRHANGLCVIGLAPAHLAFKDEGGVTAVDFNVGKSDRSGIKVTGKRKKNAQHFESNTALCKVCTKDASFIVRCCVKGSLLEVNDRLIKHPELLNSADICSYLSFEGPLSFCFLIITTTFWNSLEKGR